MAQRASAAKSSVAAPPRESRAVRKAPAGPSYLSQAHPRSEGDPEAETRYRVVDYCGDVHLYPPKP